MLLSIIVSAVSLGLAFNTFRNTLLLKRSFTSLHQPRISLLIPARNESSRIEDLIESIKLQNYSNFHAVILDDDSSDDTFEKAHNLTISDSRFSILKSEGTVPEGWLGKSWACHRLANKADGEILCFVDADVILFPSALSDSVNQMFGLNVDVVCPYPQQVTLTFLARVVQPLLQWSWMATLPLDIALKSPRTSLSAGNGQLLLISREMYSRIGGHEAVKSEVLEDIELVKAVKRAGGKGGVWDGSDIATCTMYSTSSELVEGYAKSLWKAFGSIPAGMAVSAFLLLLFFHPFFAIFSSDVRVQALSILSILFALLSRVLVHGQFRYPISASLLYPLSFLAFAVLMSISIVKKLRGTLTWKARTLNG